MGLSVEEMIATWHGLNTHLLNADERLANQMLEAEKKGRKRWRMLHRIHGRINKLRAERERRELERLSQSVARPVVEPEAQPVAEAVTVTKPPFDYDKGKKPSAPRAKPVVRW